MKRKLLLSLAAFALLLQLFSNAQVTFVEAGSGLSTKVPFGTSLADFNADGFLDVLCFDGTTTNFLATLYQNSANLSFYRIPPTWPGNTWGATQTFWADDNGDGLLDLIMTGEDESRQQLGRIYWQNPDHSFSEHLVTLPGPVTGWRDLDNDGRFDVITGFDVNWKNPNGTYTRATVSPLAEIWDGADLDNDGDLDLLTKNGTILRNDRNRRFVNTGVQLYSPLALADMDGDGRLDFVSNQPDIINGQQTFSTTLPIIFQNHGSFNFTSNAIPAGAYYYKAGAVGELSGDAKPDLLIITTQFGIGFPPLVFVNTNNHFFPNNFTFPISANAAAAVMLADFDDDGDLDVLGVENEGRRRLFRNTSNLTRPLAPPTNLRAQPNRDQVHLSWDPDPSSGATSFNLRIGTASGASDILSSQSTASGRRLLPQIGNAQTSGSWNVSGLKPGLYFWTVQAVDWSFRGSAFGEEQTFTILEPSPLPPPPTISAINNAFTDEDTPVDVSFTLGPSEALSDLQITIESSVPLLAPASNLQILGNGTNRLLRILPGSNQNGISTLTVRATDSAGQQASTSFVLSVFPVNDPPFLSTFPNEVVFNNSATLAIPFFASDIESASRFDRLDLSINSSNTNLLPNSSISFQSDFRRSTTNLVISIPTNKVGSVTIYITADDGEDQTSSVFTLLILPSQFKDAGPLPQNTAGAGMLWADFDNDGRLDLLANSASLPLLFLNKTNGFSPGFFTFPANNLGSAAVADLNRDNFIDLITVSPDAVRIFLNQSGTNFISAPVASIPKLQFPELFLADIDNDGDLDLFISGQNALGTYMRRLLINDAGVFRIISAPLGNVAGSLSLSDFDNDGWLDIAFSGNTSTGSSTNGLYHGLGAGLFQFVPGSDQSVPKVSFVTLDIDSNGQPDLLAASGKHLTAFLNDDGIFRPTTTSYDFTLLLRTWGDFDGDGLTDIIGTAGVGSTAGNALFKNQGDGHFEATLFPIPSSNTPAATLDLNNDGTLDLIANSRSFTNSVGILNAPPGAPRNLKATLSTSGMLLSWGPATDLNQPSGLTYNVRVGTSPGASDLVSASALPSGARLLLAPGNSGSRLFMILTNLTSSTYYWSVQAIDNSFAGGFFAEEQIVHFSPPDNRAPVITPDPPLFNGPEDTLGHVTFTLSDDHTLPENLKLRVFALDPNLIPFTNISLSTTGATGVISFLPITNRFGETQLEIQATDADGLVGKTFVSITISNINDPPEISAIPQQFSNGPDDPLTVQFAISDLDDLPDSLNLSVTSSDLSTLPLENISFSGSGANRSINLFTKSLAPANVDLAIIVSDPAGASATSRFTVAFTNRIFKLSNFSFPGVRAGQIAWGDLDNDSDLDLVLSGDGMINMALYINAGDGSFSKSPLLLPAPSVPLWTDLDHDNNLDLLVTGGATLYQNQGDSTFLPISTGIPSGSAVFGDFDNDGLLDLVKNIDTSTGIPRSYFMQNTPAGFVQQDNVFSLTSCLALDFEDYDLDGRLDLRVQRLGATWTNALFLQRSNILQLSPNPWPGELLLWSDFDNDGLPDALVNHHPGYSDNGVLLFLNQGGKFSGSPSILLTPFFVRDVSAADYDNDGYLDVLLNGTPNPGSGIYQTKLFHNEHSGTFREVQHPFPNYDAVHVSWADVDNDGDLDTIFTGQPPSGPYVTWLFKNTLSTTNLPPLAPTGLRATYTSEGLFVEWNPAVDPNQNGGLTYNLAVGTQPGTWDILNPISHSDGHRKIVAKGNAGWRLSKLITGLPTNQPCFFTVQAIDNSFAGSPFAPVQNIYTTSLPQLNAPSLINGMLQFTLLASPGEFYLLETSSDLKNWSLVISIDTAPVHIRAPIGSAPDMRYFRIRRRDANP